MANDFEAPLRIVSGDGHVVEPYDLWTTRLGDGPFADRAPHMTGDADEGYVFHVDGLEPFQIGLTGAAGRSDETLSIKGEVRRGGWDAAARLEDMDADAIDAEVLYPSVGMILAQTRDRDYQLSVIKSYKDWLD